MLQENDRLELKYKDLLLIFNVCSVVKEGKLFGIELLEVKRKDNENGNTFVQVS